MSKPRLENLEEIRLAALNSLRNKRSESESAQQQKNVDNDAAISTNTVTNSVPDNNKNNNNDNGTITEPQQQRPNMNKGKVQDHDCVPETRVDTFADKELKEAVMDLRKLGLAFNDIIVQGKVNATFLTALYNSMDFPIPPRSIPTRSTPNDTTNTSSSENDEVTPAVVSKPSEVPSRVPSRFGSDRWSQKLNIEVSDEEDEPMADDTNAEGRVNTPLEEKQRLELQINELLQKMQAKKALKLQQKNEQEKELKPQQQEKPGPPEPQKPNDTQVQDPTSVGSGSVTPVTAMIRLKAQWTEALQKREQVRRKVESYEDQLQQLNAGAIEKEVEQLKQLLEQKMKDVVDAAYRSASVKAQHEAATYEQVYADNEVKRLEMELTQMEEEQAASIQTPMAVDPAETGYLQHNETNQSATDSDIQKIPSRPVSNEIAEVQDDEKASDQVPVDERPVKNAPAGKAVVEPASSEEDEREESTKFPIESDKMSSNKPTENVSVEETQEISERKKLESSENRAPKEWSNEAEEIATSQDQNGLVQEDIEMKEINDDYDSEKPVEEQSNPSLHREGTDTKAEKEATSDIPDQRIKKEGDKRVVPEKTTDSKSTRSIEVIDLLSDSDDEQPTAESENPKPVETNAENEQESRKATTNDDQLTSTESNEQLNRAPESIRNDEDKADSSDAKTQRVERLSESTKQAEDGEDVTAENQHKRKFQDLELEIPKKFRKYESSLRRFRSFKFSPVYLDHVGADGYRSGTYSVKPVVAVSANTLCTNELAGRKCHNKECKMLHFDELFMNDQEILGAMSRAFIGSSTQEINDYRESLTKVLRKGNLTEFEDIAKAIVDFRSERAKKECRILDWYKFKSRNKK